MILRLSAAIGMFSAKLQQHLRDVFERTDELQFVSADALAIIEGCKDHSALVGFEATLQNDNLGFDVEQQARLANVAGIAYANLGEPELSLGRHQHAYTLIKGDAQVLPSSVDGQALWHFCQALSLRVRRLVGLQRLAEAEVVVDELGQLEQIKTDGWARNRFWEATALLVRLLRDLKRSEDVVTRVQTALVIPMTGHSTYGYQVHAELLNFLAQAQRILRRFDDAHATCLQMLALARPAMADAVREEVIWGLLEGAFIGRQSMQPHNTLLFVDGLQKLLPITDEDEQYAAMLRADALISLEQLSLAQHVLLGVRDNHSPWLESARLCIAARLAFAMGHIDRGLGFANDLIERFASDADCEDEVALATAMLNENAKARQTAAPQVYNVAAPDVATAAVASTVMTDLDALQHVVRVAIDARARSIAHVNLALYFGRTGQTGMMNKHARLSLGADLHDKGLADYDRALDILRNRTRSNYAQHVLVNAVREVSAELGEDHPFVYQAVGLLVGYIHVEDTTRLLERRELYDRRRGFALRNFGPMQPQAWTHLASMAYVTRQLGEPELAKAQMQQALVGLCGSGAYNDAIRAFEKVSEWDVRGSELDQRQREALIAKATFAPISIRTWRLRRDRQLGLRYARQCFDHAMVTIGSRVNSETMQWVQQAASELAFDASNELIALGRQKFTEWSDLSLVLLVEALAKVQRGHSDADDVPWRAIEAIASYQTAVEQGNDEGDGELERQEIEWQTTCFDDMWRTYTKDPHDRT
jgi:tetratricopeptide (TPR) repeat protein